MKCARGVDDRHCALERCGQRFTPEDIRQRYCVPEHSQEARIARRTKKLSTRPRGRPSKQYNRPADVVVLLPLGSNPTRHAFNPYYDLKLPDRRIHCRRYERCLSYAESQRWPGFECSKCDVQEPVAPQAWGKKGNNWEP